METTARRPPTHPLPRAAGGAFYDALVGLAAVDHGVPLAAADVRAAQTYASIGVDIVWVPT